MSAVSLLNTPRDGHSFSKRVRGSHQDVTMTTCKFHSRGKFCGDLEFPGSLIRRLKLAESIDKTTSSECLVLIVEVGHTGKKKLKYFFRNFYAF